MPSPSFVGIETEYGVQVVGSAAEVNPVLASSMVVAAFRPSSAPKWDHTDEHPMRDARGYELDPHEPPLDDDLGLANTILTNGARFYVDHAHPEYSSPEITNARDAVIWDKAGERIIEQAAALAAGSLRGGGRVLIHKNNTDGKGAAYGTHENYLVPRDVPFGRIVRQVIPFFVSRPVYVGAGRVGNEFGDPNVPFQMTQRADFFEEQVGLETTLKRPLVNTRDEPHSDPDKYRRLHVINGDANLCEVATFIKIGAMQIVLAMIEDDYLGNVPILADPVRAFHHVSHDLTGRRGVTLDGGSTMTALEIQWFYLAAARRFAKDEMAEDPIMQDVLDRWEAVITTAEEDPRRLAGTVDWATKLDLIEKVQDREGIAIDHPKVALIDLQYHDVRQDRGLYNRLASRGLVETLVSEDEIRAAMTTPPEDTRAWFRGTCLKRFGDQVVAAGWDSLVFDTGADALQRVPMMEPGRGTKAQVGDLLDEVADSAELVRRLHA